MGRGDQHRHRSDRESLSDPGAMWLDGVDRISSRRGLFEMIVFDRKTGVGGMRGQGEAMMAELGSVSPTMSLRL